MKKYFLFAAAALTLAACSNDESDNQLQNDNVIRLSSTVGTATRAAAGLLANYFDEGTEVTVQLSAADNSVTYDPVEYTVIGDEGDLTTTTTQYYPVSGCDVSAYAYYPADAPTTENGFEVDTDQSDADGYEASDLMYASLDELDKDNQSNNVLEFQHLLSKIVVTLVAGTDFEDDDLDDASIVLNDVQYKGTFDPENGTFTAATGEMNEADITITNAAGIVANAAVVVPQDMSGKEIAVAFGTGDPAVYPIPASTTFSPGMVYTYTITVNKRGITVKSSIADWDTGDSDSGDITF